MRLKGACNAEYHIPAINIECICVLLCDSGSYIPHDKETHWVFLKNGLYISMIHI